MSYHKITIIGHAGSDPEHEVTATGKDVAVFPLYVNVRYGEQGTKHSVQGKSLERSIHNS